MKGKTTTHPIHLQILEGLKNRQNIELRGKSIAVRNLLNELVMTDRGKAIIPPLHEEDLTIQLISNIAFPPSDKIIIEGIMRQVSQDFGWPYVSKIEHVKFYFGKLLKELLHDRVIPVFLFEHPEVMREKSFKMLTILSEYMMDRTPVGIPSIICITERGRPVSSLTSSSLVIQLEEELTRKEVTAIIEGISPGASSAFDQRVISELERLPSISQIQTTIKDLIRYMQRLGLEEINSELYHEWQLSRKGKRKYAPTTH